MKYAIAGLAFWFLFSSLPVMGKTEKHVPKASKANKKKGSHSENFFLTYEKFKTLNYRQKVVYLEFTAAYLAIMDMARNDLKEIPKKAVSFNQPSFLNIFDKSWAFKFLRQTIPIAYGEEATPPADPMGQTSGESFKSVSDELAEVLNNLESEKKQSLDKGYRIHDLQMEVGDLKRKLREIEVLKKYRDNRSDEQIINDSKISGFDQNLDPKKLSDEEKRINLEIGTKEDEINLLSAETEKMDEATIPKMEAKRQKLEQIDKVMPSLQRTTKDWADSNLSGIQSSSSDPKSFVKSVEPAPAAATETSSIVKDENDKLPTSSNPSVQNSLPSLDGKIQGGSEGATPPTNSAEAISTPTNPISSNPAAVDSTKKISTPAVPGEMHMTAIGPEAENNEYRKVGAFCINGNRDSSYKMQGGKSVCKTPYKFVNLDICKNKNIAKPTYFCPAFGMESSFNDEQLSKLCVGLREENKRPDSKLSVRCTFAFLKLIDSHKPNSIEPAKFEQTRQIMTQATKSFLPAGANKENIEEYCAGENLKNNKRQAPECFAILQLFARLEKEGIKLANMAKSPGKAPVGPTPDSEEKTKPTLPEFHNI